ncbi:MAG: ribosomal protein S18-alanine N-acetyltransferase [Acidimicrobiia bacterium]|nr:ribosomal protein S18-alanine N-acetyltransferase [Acidimicrobiia bacterium]
MSTPPVVIGPMRRRHLRQVLRIDGQRDGDGWSLGLFMAELERGDERDYLVARRGARVLGFAGMLYVVDEGHLTTLAVDDVARRQGVGSRLLAVVVRRAIDRGATALTLEVRASNEAAIGLYRRFGFAPAGVRGGYYADNGEDALIMWANGVDTLEYADRLARIEAALQPPIVVEERR